MCDKKHTTCTFNLGKWLYQTVGQCRGGGNVHFVHFVHFFLSTFGISLHSGQSGLYVKIDHNCA